METQNSPILNTNLYSEMFTWKKKTHTEFTRFDHRFNAGILFSSELVYDSNGNNILKRTKRKWKKGGENNCHFYLKQII